MRYRALATDYDGTLARFGQVDATTLNALERFRRSGRKLVLVTGRQLEELVALFPRVDLFDRIVLENGALLYRPFDRSETLLGPVPDARFLDTLKRRGVDPLALGRVIVATWGEHTSTVEETIREFGLKLQLIRNKRAVMVLPEGVDKASGLLLALEELGIPARKTVGVGDAENDLPLLAACGCGAAVGNALKMVKEMADILTIGERGDGVVELIEGLLADDLATIERQAIGNRCGAGGDGLL